MLYRHWASACLLLAAAGGWAAIAIGADSTSPDTRKVNFHIAQQPLGDALTAFGEQSGLAVAIPAALGRDVVAPPVDGWLTPSEALRQILATTGLRAEYVDRQTVAVRTAQNGPKEEVGRVAQTDQRQPQDSQATAPKEDSNATAVTPSDGGETSKSGERTEKPPVAERNGVPEILIKGSRVLNTDIKRSVDDAQPYVIFDRAQLVNSGSDNLEQFFKTHLTMDSSAAVGSQTPNPVGSMSSINLRGLGENQTLVLIDGHRAASRGVNGALGQPDLNGIPLSAIERVEILPTTASGIYGGSATGGVINVVLRRDYSGIESNLTYANAFDGGAQTRRIDVASGINLGNGSTSIILAGSYADSDNLLVSERDFLQSGRSTIVLNNPAFFSAGVQPPLGSTTNIRSATGSNLILKSGTALNSPITYVPAGYAGVSTDGGAALVANAGRYNLMLASTAQPSGGGFSGLLGGPTVESLMATIQHDFTTSLRGFIELSGSDESSRFPYSGMNGIFTLPASSPANPFRQSITLTTPAFGGGGTIVSSDNDRRIVGGMIATLPHEWTADIDYTWDQRRIFSSTPGGILAAGTAAVIGGTLNVLRDTNEYPVDFSQYEAGATAYDPVHTTLKDASVRVSGPVMQLPGGAPTISGLLEHREEILGAEVLAVNGVSSLSPGKSQAVDSIYLELKLPLLSESNRVSGIDQLQLQIAGRHDSYSTKGASLVGTSVANAKNDVSSTDPTIGLQYKPISDFMFRASYGTGFVPPSVSQLVASAPVTIPGSALGLVDPLRGGQRLSGSVTILQGGNPNLTPEKSQSWSAGAVVSPSAVAGLRASADWTHIRKTNEITNIVINQDTVNEEADLPAGTIMRAPAAPGDAFGVGPITGFNAAQINVANKTVEAMDLALEFNAPMTGAGRLDIFAAATRVIKFDAQFVSGAPIQKQAGLVNALRWRANAGVTWTWRELTIGWDAQYFDSYWFSVSHATNVNQGAATIPSQIYHDAFVTWALREDSISRLLSGLAITFGAHNVFDHRPPFVADAVSVGGNFYSPLGDPRLANYYVSLKKAF